GLLLERAAAVNGRTREGTTAVMAAAYGGHADVVQALLANRADIGVRDPRSRTVLMAAALGGNPVVGRALLSQGADLEAVDDENDTALAYAVAAGSLDVGEILLNAGAVAGRTQLMIAAARDGRLPLVRTLLGRGIDVNAQVDGGTTALAFAASRGQTTMV